MTLDVASGRAELDLAHWQKIEAGKINVTLATLLRLANALGSTVEQLFTPRASTSPAPRRRR